MTGRFVHLPAFHAMRMTKLVQIVERVLDFSIDPGFPSIRGLFGTNCNDVGKGGIDSDPETVGPDSLAKRTGHPEIIERKNSAGLRFHPEGIRVIACVCHGEYTRRIGL